MKKWILFLVLGFLLIAGGIAFYILSKPPKEKLTDKFKEDAVTKLLGRKAQLNPDIKTGNTQYKGKYISFEYPAKALVYTYRDSPASKSASLEDFSFDIKSPKLVFNMQITLGQGALEDIPSVRLRELRHYEYKKTELKVGTAKGVAYYKSGQESEKSGFFMKGGKIYTFSVTGANEREVQKLFDDIITTVSF